MTFCPDLATNDHVVCGVDFSDNVWRNGHKKTPEAEEPTIPARRSRTMNILEGMRKVYPEDSIFVTVRSRSLHFSKAAFEALGSPTGLEIFVGEEKMAAKSGSDFKFSKAEPGKADMHRICSAGMVREVKAEIGEGRVVGELVEGVLVFSRG